MFSSYVSIETRGEASVIEGAKIREALVGGAKNGRANKARFVERAQADPHLNYSARVRWSRDTDNVLRIDLIRVANQIRNRVHLSLSHYGDDSSLVSAR